MTNRIPKAARPSLRSRASYLRKYLGILTSIAGLIISVVGGFIQPVTTSDEGRSALLRFTPFLITVLAGLLFFLSQKWSRKRQAYRWFFICAASFVLSILTISAYWYLVYDRTCLNNGQRKIVGTTYTPKGQSYTSEHPNKTCEELLDDFIGEVEAIWTKESINRSRLALESSYIICISLLSICLLALGQALYSVDASVRNRAAGRKPKNAVP